MKHSIVYDDKNLADYGFYMADGGIAASPERVIETVEVPGRNGTLTIDGGRYENITVSYTMYAEDHIVDKVRGLRAFLLSRIGYNRLEDTRNPEEYRLARYEGGFDVDEWDRRRGVLTLSFDCDPRRFLRSGEMTISMTQTGTLRNPTFFASKPLLRAYGTGSITIAGRVIRITEASGFTDIDCETMNAYKGAANRNAYVSIPDGLGIEGGDNEIRLTGVTQLDITPRWWTI